MTCKPEIDVPTRAAALGTRSLWIGAGGRRGWLELVQLLVAVALSTLAVLGFLWLTMLLAWASEGA